MTSPIVLYGSVTSPFVRRVRMFALEADLPVQLVDTTTAEGRERLHAASPVWKVPTAEIEGQIVWDSGAILDVLVARAPRDVLRPMPTSALARAHETNLLHAIDEATLAAVRLMYLEKDAIHPTGAFLTKERDRVGNVLAHLERTIRGAHCTETPGFGRAELALLTSLDWMRFRERVALADYPRLDAFLTAHRERPSFVATRPE